MKRKGSERYRQLGKIEARSNEELAKPPISENSYDRVGRKEDYKLNCDLISRRSLVAGAAALAANGALFSLGAARVEPPLAPGEWEPYRGSPWQPNRPAWGRPDRPTALCTAER